MSDLESLVSKRPLTTANLGGLEVHSAIDRPDFINFLIYGESGTGKTVLCGSAADVPEMSPVLHVDIEGGSYSLRNTYPQVEVVRVGKWAELQSIYDELLMSRNVPYRTVIIDSLTEGQQFSMYGIMEELLAEKESADPDVPGIREWGKNIIQGRRFVRAFRDLPINVLFTALPMEDRNQRTGATLKLPQMSGKLSREVQAFVDFVGYYYVKQVGEERQRLLLTQRTEDTIAKDRSGLLPLVIQNPTMSDIYQLLHSSTGD